MAYDREGNTLGPCHLWTASLNKGYGQVKSDNGRTIPAYKAAWELKNGPVTKGLELHHRCKVAICVNPDHLEPEPSLAHSAEHVGTMFRTNTSGYRNVVWSKQRKMWRAEYILDKERILVGFFTDPRKASDAVAESRLTRT